MYWFLPHPVVSTAQVSWDPWVLMDHPRSSLEAAAQLLGAFSCGPSLHCRSDSWAWTLLPARPLKGRQESRSPLSLAVHFLCYWILGPARAQQPWPRG